MTARVALGRAGGGLSADGLEVQGRKTRLSGIAVCGSLPGVDLFAYEEQSFGAHQSPVQEACDNPLFSTSNRFHLRGGCADPVDA